MAAVTIHSDFRAQEEEICHYFHISPFYLVWSNGARFHDLSFKRFFHYPPSPLSRGSLVPPLSAIRVVSSTYLRLFMFLLPVLIPACNSSSPAFLMMCSVHSLNKQGDSRQPCRTPFSVLNQSVVPYRVLTCCFLTCLQVSQETGKMMSGIPISLRVFHSLLWSTQSKALV